ncbi:GNAT family N-acetyltransferase [Chromohalobacter sarecensis]|uniref:GNAT family N-acetyltransferase n=1 Tax=Chromohalobacter sarecensis TaxID=245294 RepID=A0ABV9CZW6_9GAMM|nr:GNAT family N-acetyltransferase [Chromohalobacter sarecensis]
MIESIAIVRLQADSPHAKTVAGWAHDAWGHLHPDTSPGEYRREFLAQCGEGGVPSVFVAIHEASPVGTASLVADDMSIRRELTPWLASVFVPSEWRGYGIASRLVRRVEAEALVHGIRHFHLYTPDQQALYRRLGWEDREALTYRGESVTIMSRRLDASTV